MMFRKLYNQAVLTGELEPDGPVLIVEGGASLDPVAADLPFVRTPQNGGSTVYLPGSSLKGVIRAHGERLLATHIGLPAAENPFSTDEEEVPRRQKAKDARENGDSTAVYRLSCEADRLFGSTLIAGRFRVGDAYPTEPNQTTANTTDIRYGVAIDRKKGSVQHGPFEQEAVTRGRFHFQATFENFELWMVSLVLQVLRDLNVGLVQVGHAKSRGFGTVRVKKPALTFRYPGPAPGRLEGVGARETETELREAYGVSADDYAELNSLPEPETDGLFSTYRLEGWKELNRLQTALAGGLWTSFVQRATKELDNGS